jgi:hypothetical protein
METDPKGLGLADAIEILRAEVASAQLSAIGKAVQFPVQTVTVELRIGLTKSADGKAGFMVPFIGAQLGGSAGYERETVQTVTLVLGPPVDRDGNPIKVAADSDEIKG